MKPILSCRIPARPAQSGAAAVEFALVFPILLVVAYASLVYSYVYFLQQLISFTAQQGVQAAVAVVPTTSASADSASRTTQANAAGVNTLTWLPAAQFSRLAATEPAVCPGETAPGVPTFSYEITFTLSGGTGGALFPTLINMPMGLGNIPPLPATLTACAVAFT